MRVVFRKLAGDRHELVVRDETVLVETRSLLRHDLLHWAVEAEARLEDGFWGQLARGATLASLNGRDVAPPEAGSSGGPPERGSGQRPEVTALLAVERLVGALDAASKGAAAAAAVANVRRFDEASGLVTPGWLTEDLVLRVQERLRHLLGAWGALPPGGALTLEWPPPR